MRYDLHSHSTASDGVLSPARLVSRAAWAGLDGLALTDHDCVDGVDEALAAADEHGLELIPGIELSVQVDGRDVHVLGYWIDHASDTLRGILLELTAMRHRRAERMVDLLQSLGCAVTYGDVLEQAGDGNPGRPHVAKALLARGEVSSLEDAFARYIGDDGPAYVPKTLMDPERGFALLAEYGAVPVWAHPALTDYEPLLERFVSLGLKGLEVDHPKHSVLDREQLRARCRELGLVATGGSDFHQPGSGARDLGAEGVASEALAALRALRPAGRGRLDRPGGMG
ncbi:MAG: PHP domain-containing protein [Candidatus Krumholzibacteriia bacterium]